MAEDRGEYLEDYKPVWDGFEGLAATMTGNQPGDQKNGVERMIEILKSEGMSKGKSFLSGSRLDRMFPKLPDRKQWRLWRLVMCAQP